MLAPVHVVEMSAAGHPPIQTSTMPQHAVAEDGCPRSAPRDGRPPGGHSGIALNSAAFAHYAATRLRHRGEGWI